MDKRLVENGLLKKGFLQDQGNHHYFIYFTFDGKKTPIKTKTSHGSKKYKTLGPELLSQMARQCHLTKPDFKDLIECPMDQKSYEKRLHEQNLI